MTLHVKIEPRTIADFCARHHIVKMSLFGSVIRDDFTPASDIDVIVEFAAGTRVSLLDIVGIEDELTEVMGRRVDMHTPKSLSRYIRDEVLREAVPIYDAA